MKSLFQMLKQVGGKPSDKTILDWNEQDIVDTGFNQANAQWREYLEGIDIPEEVAQAISQTNILKRGVSYDTNSNTQ